MSLDAMLPRSSFTASMKHLLALSLRYSGSLLILSCYFLGSCDISEQRSLGRPKGMSDEQIIGLCGAGHLRGGEAQLAAELQRSGGKFTGSFKSVFAARAIENRENLESKEIDSMYRSFLECLDKRLNERESQSNKYSAVISTNTILRQRHEGSMRSSPNAVGDWSGGYAYRAIFTNLNDVAVVCHYEVYSFDEFREFDLPLRAHTKIRSKMSTDELSNVERWLRQAVAPSDCEFFFENDYDMLADGGQRESLLSSNIYSDHDKIADSAEAHAGALLEHCAIHYAAENGDIPNFQRGYLYFEPHETKELELSGAEHLPSPPNKDLGVLRTRTALLNACWRA